MRIDELPRSENIDDRRGVRMRRSGGIGIGMLVVLGLIGWALGIDPRLLIGGAEVLTGGEQSQPPSYSDTKKTGEASTDQMKEFVAAVLGSTEVQWKELFAKGNARYVPPTLVMFSGATSSACGFAQSAMGPFYCPVDRKVYIDLGFYDELEQSFDAPGDFAQAYVIAHEVGHHVQKLLGISEQVQRERERMSQEEYNQVSVRLELQADFFAGVWAHHAQEARDLLGEARKLEALAIELGQRVDAVGGEAADRHALRSVDCPGGAERQLLVAPATPLATHRDRIGTDMLGNTAGFAFRHLGFPDRVE